MPAAVTVPADQVGYSHGRIAGPQQQRRPAVIQVANSSARRWPDCAPTAPPQATFTVFPFEERNASSSGWRTILIAHWRTCVALQDRHIWRTQAFYGGNAASAERPTGASKA